MPQLVKDIHTGPSFQQSMVDYAVLRDELLFITSDGVLWKTDGSQEGSVPIKNLDLEYAKVNLTAVENSVYFAAANADGVELWRSDGTSTGTYQVTDIRRGALSSFPEQLKPVGNTLFFTADDGVHGRELWKTDGTQEGTLLVRDVFEGHESSNPGGLTAFNDTVFFWAHDSQHGWEIWTSDGSGSGTHIVADTIPGIGSGLPDHLTVVGDSLFFMANRHAESRGLWYLDANDMSFNFVGDPGSGRISEFPEQFTAHENTLYFVIQRIGVIEIWKAEKDSMELVTSVPSSSQDVKILSFVNGNLIVADSHNVWGINVASDLVLLNEGDNIETVQIGNEVYFRSDNSLHVTDGTAAGTREIRSFPEPVLIPNLIDFNGNLAFELLGDLWISDGTTAGTASLMNIGGAASHSVPTNLVDVDGTVFFVASDQSNGRELWRSDGTTDQTRMVVDITEGRRSSRLDNLTASGGALFFSRMSETQSFELWTSDGTEQGTVLLNETQYDNIDQLTDVDGTLLFRANDSEQGGELWRSDGTPSGTVKIADIPPGALRDNFVQADGVLFFAAKHQENAWELWKSDGTTLGTERVTAISPGFPDSPEFDFVPVGNRVFFVASDRNHGNELWITDGTEEGTRLVKDIHLGRGNSMLGFNVYSQTIGNVVYFPASDGRSGLELWRSDGTELGTYRVADMYPGSEGSNPFSLTAVDSEVFFFAFSEKTRYRLWRTDGQADSVQAVGDLRFPNHYASSFVTSHAVAGRAVFLGNDNELWVTNESGDGVLRLGGVFQSRISRFFRFGDVAISDNRLFFVAQDLIRGEELWMLDLNEERIVGDVNRDGVFDSSDLVAVFSAGEYEDSEWRNSSFEEGDWNGDGDFTSADLVLVFQEGAYVSAARIAGSQIAAAIDRVFATDDDGKNPQAFVE